MRRVIATIGAIFAVIAGGIAFAPTASAAGYGCSGNLIDTYPAKTTGGTQYGVVQLYYSTANGGTNCAVLIDTYFGSGVAKSMNVGIYRCVAGTTAGGNCDGKNFDLHQLDSGTYTSYAGPVSVTGTSSRCISLLAYEDNPNSSDPNSFAGFSTVALHC
ncbi:hypothetical protein [Streptomyces seoulensis]|uniref:hypothetical protein n=1 Tax=Streptomyces seoulensis TaxID=73044 RepID=UPI0033ABF1DD